MGYNINIKTFYIPTNIPTILTYFLGLCPHSVLPINFYKSLIKIFLVSPTALAVWQKDCRPFFIKCLNSSPNQGSIKNNGVDLFRPTPLFFISTLIY